MIIMILTIWDVVEGQRGTACAGTSTGHPDVCLEAALIVPQLLREARCLHHQHILYGERERAALVNPCVLAVLL